MLLSVLFTKLDLRNAYYLIWLWKWDEWMMTFNTRLGHVEYLVMPFGLTNTPAVFQALVNDMICCMLNRFLYVYIDNILIFSETLEEHIQQVHLVLQHLLENILFAKAKECEFHVKSVTFLEFIIQGGNFYRKRQR